MRLVRLYGTFMTAVRPSIGWGVRLHMRACGSLQLTETHKLEFTGPE